MDAQMVEVHKFKVEIYRLWPVSILILEASRAATCFCFAFAFDVQVAQR